MNEWEIKKKWYVGTPLQFHTTYNRKKDIIKEINKILNCHRKSIYIVACGTETIPRNQAIDFSK